LLPGSHAAGYRAGCGAVFDAIASRVLMSQAVDPAGTSLAGVRQSLSPNTLSSDRPKTRSIKGFPKLRSEAR
jgi:hypothetical protein